MSQVGKSVLKVDAFDKVTGRAKYEDDLCDKNALVISVVRSTIAHGYVKSIDVTEAMKMPGVVKIFTCFDVPDIKFPTADIPGLPIPATGRGGSPAAQPPCALLWGRRAAVVAENEWLPRRLPRR